MGMVLDTHSRRFLQKLTKDSVRFLAGRGDDIRSETEEFLVFQFKSPKVHWRYYRSSNYRDDRGPCAREAKIDRRFHLLSQTKLLGWNEFTKWSAERNVFAERNECAKLLSLEESGEKRLKYHLTDLRCSRKAFLKALESIFWNKLDETVDRPLKSSLRRIIQYYPCCFMMGPVEMSISIQCDVLCSAQVSVT